MLITPLLKYPSPELQRSFNSCKANKAYQPGILFFAFHRVIVNDEYYFNRYLKIIEKVYKIACTLICSDLLLTHQLRQGPDTAT